MLRHRMLSRAPFMTTIALRRPLVGNKELATTCSTFVQRRWSTTAAVATKVDNHNTIDTTTTKSSSYSVRPSTESSRPSSYAIASPSPTHSSLEYCNYNETLTARKIINSFGHLLVPGSIAALDQSTGEVMAALAGDAANPASTKAALRLGSTTSNSAQTSSSNSLHLDKSSVTESPNQKSENTFSSSSLVPISVRIGGRVVSVRDMGKVVFVTIRSDGELLQLGANVTDEFYASKQILREAITDKLNTGDIIGAEGTVGRTKKGELSIYVRKLSVLAPYVCADMSVCPDQRTFVVGEKDNKKPPNASKTEQSSKGSNVTKTELSQKDDGGTEPKLSKKERKKLKKQQKEGTEVPLASTEKDISVSSNASTQSEVENKTSNDMPPASSPITTLTPKNNVINDADLRYRYRFVDLLARPQGVEVFRLRHKVISSLRSFLDARDFTEVETPMFHTIPCGANAKPFMTHHNSNNSDLYLRIAPELYLKQCVVGGMERVYEIGKVFRNEDTDKSHNPEFTSCEFYAAYKTYVDLMGWTEELLRHIAIAATGTTILKLPVSSSPIVPETDEKNTISPNETVTAAPPIPAFVEVDLARPFKRVSVLDEIECKAGVMFPPIHEINSSFGIAFMAALMLKHNIPAPTVRTPAKFLDKLIDHFITDNTTEPIFVCDHPLFMSPLAKEHEWSMQNNTANNAELAQQQVTVHEELNALFNVSAFSATGTSENGKTFPTFTERHGKRGLSERFELFINGMEVCNAYSELCDPNEQMKRFEQQLQAKELGDDEAMELDETFLKALQVGLPPTAGWGMGIDRLVMLLSGHTSIRDVILFPLLKPQNDAANRRRSKTAGFFGFNPNMTLFALSSLEAELKRRGDRAGCEQLLQTKRIVQQTGKDPQQHRQQLMKELECALQAQREQFYWLHGDDVAAQAQGSNSETSSSSGELMTWPPRSASALASLMGFGSTASPPSSENISKSNTFTTSASISSSSTSDSHVTTTTTTTTTTVAPRVSVVSNRPPIDAWGKARRLAYRHNPVWKFMVRVMGRNTD